MGDWKLHTGGRAGGIHVFSLDRALEIDKEGWHVPDRSQVMQRNLVDRLNYHGVQCAAGNVARGTLTDLRNLWSNAAAHNTTFVALPNTSQATCAWIRRMSDLNYGLRAVCAKTSKINWYPRPFPRAGQLMGFQGQPLDNIALKLNIKAGGVNHKFDAQPLKLHLGVDNPLENTIVFGADVGHPGSGSVAGIPSVACVVASLDIEFQNYPGSMRLQAGGQEVSSVCKLSIQALDSS
jgi:hypothetical protein